MVDTATGVSLSSAKSIIPVPVTTISSNVLSGVKEIFPKSALPLNVMVTLK